MSVYKSKILWCVAACVALAACGKRDGETRKPPQRASVPSSDTATAGTESDELPPPPPEGREVVAFVNGKAEVIRESQARERGLSIIDLSNYWVPFLFSERDNDSDPPKRNTYRRIFRTLANDWPYESPSMRAARELYEKARRRRRLAKIAQLREEGLSDSEIAARFGVEDLSAITQPNGKDSAATDTEEETEEENEAELDIDGAGTSDHYLEVYGIPPTLSVLKKRAEQEIDRPCFSEVDYTRIRAFSGFAAYVSNDRAKQDARRGRRAAKRARKAAERLGITDLALLQEHISDNLPKPTVAAALQYEALVEAQKQLLCEGLYPESSRRYVVGGLDWKTHVALERFERKNRIFGWGYFGSETLAALKQTPKDRLYSAFVRVLNERIADSLGVIEDGSARNPDGSPATYVDAEGKTHPVPNLIAQLTALTLKHMDLTSPDKVLQFLRDHTDKQFNTLFVAVPLPQLPPYYSDEMDLFARIDRGDVWYDYPYTYDPETKEFRRRAQPRKRMPTTTLYVRWNDQEIPLVTMNTTIGSWRTELAPDGYEYFKYKNSDVGPRIWKDIVAGPVWMPPDTTPIGDLTKKVSYKHQLFEVPNYSEFGPHYASAYGLVAAFHHRVVTRKDGTTAYLDNGIRSHGSVDYNSILRRYSHGCHRLYNHLAIRLFDFVLRHKHFVRVGEIPAGYARTIETEEGNTFTIRLDSRGYKYELANPVPVFVSKGRIQGRQKTPIEHYMPKPGETYGPDAQFLPEEYAFLMEQDTDSASGTGEHGDTAQADTAATTAARPSDDATPTGTGGGAH